MSEHKDESIPKAPARPVAPVAPVVPVAQEPVEPRRRFWQALFFTKDGRLDIMQLLLGICCGVGLSVFILQASGSIPPGRPDREAWGWFAVFTSFCFGAGAWTNAAALKSKGISAITQIVADRRGVPRVAPASTPSTEPNLFTDDESA